MTGKHKDEQSGDRSPAGQDLRLELNFVPEWARKPSGGNPYADARYRETAPRRDKRDRHGSRRPPPGGRSGPRRPRPGGRDDARAGRDPDQRPRHDPDQRHHRHAPPAPRTRLPLTVSFLPDRDKLGLLVRELHKRPRAYPLMDLASLLMQRPDHYLVKIQAHQARGGGEPLNFFQCKRCRTVFLQQDEALAHAGAAHLDEVYDATEVVLDPPTGNYVCVCRCRKTGILLGPPNYHGFQEKLQQVVDEHFPGMSVTRYREQVETVHDSDLVETWRNEKRSRNEYRERGEESAPVLSGEEARAFFMERHAPRMVHRSNRVIVPATVAQAFDESDLKSMIREAWQKEIRFPLTMSLAMRPAFKHMRLFLFKADERTTFISPIHPSPVDPAHAVPSVREIIQYLHDHPGCTRTQLVEGLRPGCAPDAPEVAEVVRHFRWLIDKGHVIEFYNGTLAVPGRARR